MKADLIYRSLEQDDPGARPRTIAFLADTMGIGVEAAERMLDLPGSRLAMGLELAEAGKRAESLRGQGLRVEVVKSHEPRPPAPETRKEENDPAPVIEGKLKLPEDARASAGETMPCPLCGETILAVARKCKHCGQMLKPPLAGEDAPEYVGEAEMEKAKQLVAQLGDLIHAPLQAGDIEVEAPVEEPSKEEPAEGEKPPG